MPSMLRFAMVFTVALHGVANYWHIEAATTTGKLRVGVFIHETETWNDDQQWKSTMVTTALASQHFNERNDSIIEELATIEDCSRTIETIFLNISDCQQGELENQIDISQLDVVFGPNCHDEHGHSGLALAAHALNIPYMSTDAETSFEAVASHRLTPNSFRIAAPTHESADAVMDLYSRFGHAKIILLYEQSPTGLAWRASLEKATLRSPSLKIVPFEIIPNDINAIEVAVEAARRSGLRSILAAVSEDSFTSVTKFASQYSMLGDGWLWTFTDMLDSKTLQTATSVPLEGSLYLSSRGLETSILKDKKPWELLSRWLDNASSNTISSLVNRSGFDVDLRLDDSASLAFDGIAALGFGMCSSLGQVESSGMAETSFQGTSGLIVFDNYGRRLHSTMTVYLRNLVGGDSLGYKLENVAEWLGEIWAFTKTVHFAGGGSKPPLDGLEGLTPSSEAPSGYYMGHLEQPTCWVTYHDPQHTQYTNGEPELLASCPMGLNVILESNITMELVTGRTYLPRVDLVLGSSECPNYLGNCSTLVEVSDATKTYAEVQISTCEFGIPFCVPPLGVANSFTASPIHNPALITSLKSTGVYSTRLRFVMEASFDTILVHAKVLTVDKVQYNIARIAHKTSMPAATAGTPTKKSSDIDKLNCREYTSGESNQETSRMVSCPSQMRMTVDFAGTPIQEDGDAYDHSSVSFLAGVPRPFVFQLQANDDDDTTSSWIPSSISEAVYCRAGTTVCSPESVMGMFPTYEISAGRFEATGRIPETGDYIIVVSSLVTSSDGEKRILASKSLAVSVLASEGPSLSSTGKSTEVEEGYHLGHLNESICWVSPVNNELGEPRLVHEPLSRCPSGIHLRFLNHPRLPLRREQLQDFEVSIRVEVGSEYDPNAIEAGKHWLSPMNEVDIPHVNLHFCNRKVRFCTPFLRGLSVDLHSNTLPNELTREDDMDLPHFTTSSKLLNLAEGKYTMLAHIRFLSDQGTLQWDVATALPVEISTYASDDLSLIPQEIHTVGLCATVLLWAVELGLVGWIVKSRSHIVLQTSQFQFLFMLLTGTSIIGMNVLLNGLEDDVSNRADENGGNIHADLGCMGSIVTYCFGFVLSYAPLLAKLHKTAEDYDGRALRRITLERYQKLRICAKYLGADLIVCAVWFWYDTPYYARHDIVTDQLGFPIKSYGQCTSQHFSSYMLLLLSIHGIAGVMGSVYAFRTINFKTAFSEARYVGVALVACIVPYAFVMPIVFLVESSSTSRFSLIAVFAIVCSFTTLFFIFFPKIVFVQGNKTSVLRNSLQIDETFEAKVSPTNSPTKSPHQPKMLGFAVTPVEGLSTLSIRPIASDWVDPDSDDDDQGDLAPIHKAQI